MKARRRYTSKTRSGSRRWHIPPPLIHGTEPLEGGQILQEWDGTLGVVLWQTFRDTLLWATSEPAKRKEAFSPTAGGALAIELASEDIPDEDAREGLKSLAELVRKPGRIRDDQVARSCRRISEWAVANGKLQTALAFAQTSALAARTDAGAALWVANTAVRVNDHARAEIWYRRGIGLARRARDWRMYSRAFAGLGNLYMRRGNMPVAGKLQYRALRGARRGGMRREQAVALHELFLVSIETSSPLEAQRLAQQALETYGLRSNRVHVLAHDVAFFWMEQGHFDRALPVFEAVLPHIRQPMERLFVQANLARAAGGMGAADVAQDAAGKVASMLSDGDLHVGGGRAFLEVARGYAMLGDRIHAEAAANRTILFAERFRESKVRFAAEALLDSLRKPTPTAVENVPAPTVEEKVEGDRLVADFVRVLETTAGVAH